MNKEKLLYSIGEVAKDLNLEQHVLRFWESQFSQIKPIKHRRRRFYDHKCIEKIKSIKHMLYDRGYTIKGAQKELAKNASVATVSNDNKSKHLEDSLKEIIELRDYIMSKMNCE